MADLKIMDAGEYEAEVALRAGADYITVLGVTDERTVQGCIEAISVHTGVDQQAMGRNAAGISKISAGWSSFQGQAHKDIKTEV